MIHELQPHGAVIQVLARIADDPESKARLALASTMGHGESVWVGELAYHGALAGHPVRREVTFNGFSRVDLDISGIAVEVKSSHTMRARKSSDAQRRVWWGKDLNSLMHAPNASAVTSPAVLLISVALIDAGFVIRRESPRRDYARKRPPKVKTDESAFIEGFSVAEQFLKNEGLQPVRIDMGNAKIAGSRAAVRIGAVVASVQNWSNSTGVA